jgi:lysophospholipid acyltransferase (LPLAT)-like uncharacterized protein
VRERRLTFLQRCALAVVPRVVAPLISLLGRTLRWEEVSEPGALPDDNGDVAIYCFWHRALLLAAWFFHRRNIAILISQSFDGELIARTVERLDFLPVRGSSSRGGAVGLRAMQSALATGAAKYAAFTSDGPRGPVYVAKPGAVKMAQWTGARVGTFYLLAERAWTLRSWDRFMIPRPFSRVVVSWARPVEVQRGEDDETSLTVLQNAMDRARALAELHIAEGKPGSRRGIYGPKPEAR